MLPSAAAGTINKQKTIRTEDKMVELKFLNYKIYITR